LLTCAVSQAPAGSTTVTITAGPSPNSVTVVVRGSGARPPEGASQIFYPANLPIPYRSGAGTETKLDPENPAMVGIGAYCAAPYGRCKLTEARVQAFVAISNTCTDVSPASSEFETNREPLLIMLVALEGATDSVEQRRCQANGPTAAPAGP